VRQSVFPRFDTLEYFAQSLLGARSSYYMS